MGVDMGRNKQAWPFDAFGRHLAASRSTGTVQLRLSHLRLFARRYRQPYAVQRRDIEHYIGGLHTAEYQKSVLASLRLFYAWAIDEGHTIADPTRGVKGRPVRSLPGQPCDRRKLDAALAAADPDTRLMIELGARLGLRRAEIARVHCDDVTSCRGWLNVTGKGDKHRLVPLDDELAELIGQRSGWLFPGRFGGPMTAGNVGRRVQRAGIKPHSLRHFAGTEAYLATRDIVLVQQVLGHASISTTQRYIGVSDDRIREGWNDAMRASRRKRLQAL